MKLDAELGQAGRDATGGAQRASFAKRCGTTTHILRTTRSVDAGTTRTMIGTTTTVARTPFC